MKYMLFKTIAESLFEGKIVGKKEMICNLVFIENKQLILPSGGEFSLAYLHMKAHDWLPL